MTNNSVKPVIILGAGGHAKVLMDMLFLTEREVLGVIDPVKSRGDMIFGVPVIGDDESILNYLPSEIELVNGIGSLPNKNGRWKVAESYRDKGYNFSSLVHPSAVISNDVYLDEGVQVMAGVVIQPGVRVGKDSIINTGATVDHDCIIGSMCHIAPGSNLCGSILVQDNVHIGTGASLVQGVTINSNVVIAAGSTVIRDIAMNTIYKGI